MNEAVIAALARDGLDCLTCEDAGNRTLSDESQLSDATQAGRVLVTQNAGDFGALHRRWLTAGRTHAGIIILTDQRTPPGVQIRAFRRVAEEFDDLRDAIVFLLNYA